MKQHILRNYLITGLLVWLPIWATIVVVGFIVDTLDRTLSLVPASYRPDQLFGFHVPGMGVLLSLVILLLTGLLATNILGKRLVMFGEAILAKIPLVRTVYNAVKQVSETLFSSQSQAFRQALLIEYPRKGLWTICFQTGSAGGSHMVDPHSGEAMMTVFIPTTPNPTSGFLILVPKKDTVPLDMTVDEALKMVISLGIMQPATPNSVSLPA